MNIKAEDNIIDTFIQSLIFKEILRRQFYPDTMNKSKQYIVLLIHVIYLNNNKFGESTPINNFEVGNGNNILPPEEPPSDLCFISETSETGKFV